MPWCLDATTGREGGDERAREEKSGIGGIEVNAQPCRLPICGHRAVYGWGRSPPLPKCKSARWSVWRIRDVEFHWRGISSRGNGREERTKNTRLAFYRVASGIASRFFAHSTKDYWDIDGKG